VRGEFPDHFDVCRKVSLKQATFINNLQKIFLLAFANRQLVFANRNDVVLDEIDFIHIDDVGTVDAGKIGGG